MFRSSKLALKCDLVCYQETNSHTAETSDHDRALMPLCCLTCERHLSVWPRLFCELLITYLGLHLLRRSWMRGQVLPWFVFFFLKIGNNHKNIEATFSFIGVAQSWLSSPKSFSFLKNFYTVHVYIRYLLCCAIRFFFSSEYCFFFFFM